MTDFEYIATVWETSCIDTMLSDFKECKYWCSAVLHCYNNLIRGKLPTKSLIIIMRFYFPPYICCHSLILIPKDSLIKGLSNYMLHECF